MRDSLFFLLNGQPTRVRGRAAMELLATFLRREKALTGTKLACSEGACGSCSVLLGKPTNDGFDYKPVNACILPLFACDGCHIITVEGLNGPEFISGGDTGILSPVQNAMVECHGAQCGFCTPGIVITLTAFHEKSCGENSSNDVDVQAALEGNLCRCTGYTPIIEAGTQVETAQLRPLNELYPPENLRAALENNSQDAEIIVPADELENEQHLFVPRTWEAALQWKSAHPQAVVVTGGTEVGVSMSAKGYAPREILSLANVQCLDETQISDGVFTLGARATWTQVAEAVREVVPEFAALLRRWGSPQLRNVGTVAGNIVRASPVSDSLPFFLVCNAQLEVESIDGKRQISVADFLNGDKLQSDELLRQVVVPLPAKDETLRLFKVAKRRAYDRSIVSAAFVCKLHEDKIESFKIAFGGVAPEARRLKQTEDFLRDKPLGDDTWQEAAAIAQIEIAPVSNYAAQADYRRQLVANLIRKFGSQLQSQ